MSTGYRDAYYESQFIYTPKGKVYSPTDAPEDRPADAPTDAEIRAEGVRR